MSFNLFGYEISKSDPDQEKLKNQTILDIESDGSSDIVLSSAGGHLVQYLDDFIPTEDIARIISYREIANCTEIDKAISEIIGDAITDTEEVSELPVSVNLDSIEGMSDNIKEKISAEFEEIMYLLKYNNFFPKYFRQWYVDGRLYYHIVVDTSKPQEGIQQLINLESTRIKKYREITKDTEIKETSHINKVTKVQEYFVYFPKDHWTTSKVIKLNDFQDLKNVVRFSPEAIAYAPSGLLDEEGETISHLHKAIRPANQLSSIEDSMVVYRMTRAPERRVFYIDVGQLPKQKSEQYLANIMSKYRHKVSYDSKTGKMINGKDQLAMLEDYWLPRREGGKGTQIETLSGGDSNMMDSESALYFRKKLYDSLNVPTTRLESDSMFSMAKSGEISRDEIKFTKFIIQLRNTFAFHLFNDLLKKQLVLKKVINDDEWEDIEKYLKYDFTEDSHFSELKILDVLRTRLDVLRDIDEYKDKYFSRSYIRSNVLHQDDEEQKELEKERESEQKDPEVKRENEEVMEDEQ